MGELANPGIYLIAREADAAKLAALLDAAPVACVRLDMHASVEDEVLRAADTLRPVCHERDVAFLLTDHFRLVQQTGCDGVHLTNGTSDIRAARAEIDQEGIVGAYCGASRHSGLTAGEIGVEYVSFGPLGDTGLGAGNTAPHDLFGWWSETIEIPVVAEGGLDEAMLSAMKEVTDFFALGPEVWHAAEPAKSLKRFHEIISGTG